MSVARVKEYLTNVKKLDDIMKRVFGFPLSVVSRPFPAAQPAGVSFYDGKYEAFPMFAAGELRAGGGIVR